MYISSFTATLTRNTIQGNSAQTAGGGIFAHYGAGAEVRRNMFSANVAQDGAGIYCNTHSYLEIYRNTFTGNTASGNGGAIACPEQSSPLIRRNVITQNSAGGLGDGIYTADSSFPVVDSNDIYANGYGVHNADNSGMLMADNNYWGDPSGPYHQSLNPQGLGDSVNAFVDCVPWATVSGTFEPVASTTGGHLNLLASPDPFRDVVQVRYTLPEPARVNLRIYSVTGRELDTLVDRPETQGEHLVLWRPVNLAPGVYFFQLKGGGFTETRRAVLLR